MLPLYSRKLEWDFESFRIVSWVINRFTIDILRVDQNIIEILVTDVDGICIGVAAISASWEDVTYLVMKKLWKSCHWKGNVFDYIGRGEHGDQSFPYNQS